MLPSIQIPARSPTGSGAALLLALLAGLALPCQARADDEHGHHGPPGHERPGHERMEHRRVERDWHDNGWRAWEHHYGRPPVVYRPPPAAIYVPPPVVTAPPAGLSIIVPLTIR